MFPPVRGERPKHGQKDGTPFFLKPKKERSAKRKKDSYCPRGEASKAANRRKLEDEKKKKKTRLWARKEKASQSTQKGTMGYDSKGALRRGAVRPFLRVGGGQTGEFLGLLAEKKGVRSRTSAEEVPAKTSLPLLTRPGQSN